MGMSVPERRVIVVGGGAAGMMASIFAGKAGARVTLLERGEKLGKKVYITGKGRCNVTNDCTLDEFLHEVARLPAPARRESPSAQSAAQSPDS